MAYTLLATTRAGEEQVYVLSQTEMQHLDAKQFRQLQWQIDEAALNAQATSQEAQLQAQRLGNDLLIRDAQGNPLLQLHDYYGQDAQLPLLNSGGQHYHFYDAQNQAFVNLANGEQALLATQVSEPAVAVAAASGSDSLPYVLGGLLLAGGVAAAASGGSGGGSSSTPSSTPTPTPGNHAPVITSAATLSGSEDTALTLSGSATDADGDALTHSFTNPVNGTIRHNGTNYEFVPTENYSGAASVLHTVSDGKGGVVSQTVNIQIAPVNDAPVALAPKSGLTISDLPTDAEIAVKSITLPDGKYLVLGGGVTPSGDAFVMTRYNADGSLDSSFGNAGVVSTAFAGIPADVIQNADGSFMLLGDELDHSGNTAFMVSRYHADGSLDTNFGTSGVVKIDFAYPVESYRILQQSDGRYLLLSSAHNGEAAALVRLDISGNLDPSFGIGGKVENILDSPIHYDNVYMNDIIQSADGKIIIAGYLQGTSDDAILLARYDLSGNLDSSFGNNGVVKKEMGVQELWIFNILQTQDGKLIVGGSIQDNSGDDYFLIMRFDSNGQLDTSFGVNGSVQTDVGIDNNEIQQVIELANGNLLALGYQGTDDDRNIVLVRYDANGNQDMSFGENGKAVLDLAEDSYGIEVKELADGKLLVTGYTGEDDQEKFLLARFNADGSLDNQFGTQGFSTAQGNDFVFNSNHFAYSDVDGDALSGIEITAVPTQGQLLLNHAAVANGAIISVSDIAAGNLLYQPNGAGNAEFSYKVIDNSGASNNSSLTSATFGIEII